MKLIRILQVLTAALIVSSSQSDGSGKLDIQIHQEEDVSPQLVNVLYNNSRRETQAIENIANKIGSLEVQEETFQELNQRLTKVEKGLGVVEAIQCGCTCKFPFIRLHDSCYYFEIKGETRDWSMARATCQMLSADLVSLETEEEAKAIKEFLLDFLHPNGDKERSYWIGATDMVHEGEFLWVSGHPVIYSDFPKGEPNDMEENEDCIQLYIQWNDLDCESKIFFICEKPCL